MAATATTALGALWVVMAAALIWATEFLGGNPTKSVFPPYWIYWTDIDVGFMHEEGKNSYSSRPGPIEERCQ